MPREMLRALARDAAQHGIDQPGIARRAPVGLRQPHREIDRGVIRHVEPEDLRRAEQQRGLDPRRVGRQAALEQMPEQMPQRAEPAQHRRDQPAHQGAVAIGQRGEIGMRGLVVELLVERSSAPQHAVEDVGGDPARREAGRIDACRAP